MVASGCSEIFGSTVYYCLASSRMKMSQGRVILSIRFMWLWDPELLSYAAVPLMKFKWSPSGRRSQKVLSRYPYSLIFSGKGWPKQESLSVTIYKHVHLCHQHNLGSVIRVRPPVSTKMLYTYPRNMTFKLEERVIISPFCPTKLECTGSPGWVVRSRHALYSSPSWHTKAWSCEVSSPLLWKYLA